jgi:hypothetical protein
VARLQCNVAVHSSAERNQSRCSSGRCAGLRQAGGLMLQLQQRLRVCSSIIEFYLL